MSVYIHGGLRSPIGVLNGQYKHMRPEILGSQVIDEIINRYSISHIDGIFCGNAVGTGGNLGRLMGLMCNLPNYVPAITVDMQCASALMSIEIAYAHILFGIVESICTEGQKLSEQFPGIVLVICVPNSWSNYRQFNYHGETGYAGRGRACDDRLRQCGASVRPRSAGQLQRYHPERLLSDLYKSGYRN